MVIFINITVPPDSIVTLKISINKLLTTIYYQRDVWRTFSQDINIISAWRCCFKYSSTLIASLFIIILFSKTKTSFHSIASFIRLKYLAATYIAPVDIFVLETSTFYLRVTKQLTEVHFSILLRYKSKVIIIVIRLSKFFKIVRIKHLIDIIT